MIVAEDWCMCIVCYWGSNDFSDMGWCRFVNDCVETVVVISGVVNGTDRTVWFDKGVLTFDYITITFFGLRLDVTGMWVLDAIVERVFWIGLTHRVI